MLAHFDAENVDRARPFPSAARDMYCSRIRVPDKAQKILTEESREDAETDTPYLVNIPHESAGERCDCKLTSAGVLGKHLPISAMKNIICSIESFSWNV